MMDGQPTRDKQQIHETINNIIQIQKNQGGVLKTLNDSVQKLVVEINNSNDILNNVVTDLADLKSKYDNDLSDTNTKINNEHHKLSSIKTDVKSIGTTISGIKSQTVDIIDKLSHSIKDYDKQIKKLTFISDLGKNEIQFYSKFYNTKLELFENELNTIKMHNEQLNSILEKMLVQNNSQFEKMFEILNNLENGTNVSPSAK